MYLVVLSSRGNPGKVDPARFMKQMYSGRITVGGGGVGTGKAYLRIKSTYILQLITVFFFFNDKCLFSLIPRDNESFSNKRRCRGKNTNKALVFNIVKIKDLTLQDTQS